jgi:hypothetical protein
VGPPVAAAVTPAATSRSTEGDPEFVSRILSNKDMRLGSAGFPGHGKKRTLIEEEIWSFSINFQLTDGILQMFSCLAFRHTLFGFFSLISFPLSRWMYH